MLTRIEIDGFKSFEKFSLDLQPFTAIVGPNATGKSNLFDALQFLSLLAQTDIRSAMADLRGEPLELFRKVLGSKAGRIKQAQKIRISVELLLPADGVDAFGEAYEIKSRRIGYTVEIQGRRDEAGGLRGVVVSDERCWAIAKKDDGSFVPDSLKGVRYSGQLSDFISVEDDRIRVRQDGPKKRGRPVFYPLSGASRTALSTISSAEFPHLYALKEILRTIQFLQIDPLAARRPSDRLAQRQMQPDASNLATVLARISEETSTDDRPDGTVADIAADLASLIPSVSGIKLRDTPSSSEYSFDLRLRDDLSFSARVISDGTLRLLALVTLLNDPERRGILCFEEPENGVHEGRIPALIEFLRAATDLTQAPDDPFQIVLNTHSPAVMAELNDHEIVAADLLRTVRPDNRTSTRTRMRTGVSAQGDMISETTLSRIELDRLLRNEGEAA